MSDALDGWILLDRWCEIYDERPNTIHKRIQEGLWPRGEYAACPDGLVMYLHEERCKVWLAKRGKLVL